MCILAGCDFVDSIPGLGVKKAHAHMKRLRCVFKVARSMRMAGARVAPSYDADVQRALWTFLHQR